MKYQSSQDRRKGQKIVDTALTQVKDRNRDDKQCQRCCGDIRQPIHSIPLNSAQPLKSMQTFFRQLTEPEPDSKRKM
jgi:hypothetical protein